MDILVRIGNYEGGYRGTVWVDGVQFVVAIHARRSLREAGDDAGDLYWLIVNGG